MTCTCDCVYIFNVLLMMGAESTRNMYSNLVLCNKYACLKLHHVDYLIQYEIRKHRLFYRSESTQLAKHSVVRGPRGVTKLHRFSEECTTFKRVATSFSTVVPTFQKEHAFSIFRTEHNDSMGGEGYGHEHFPSQERRVGTTVLALQ